ncbi:MAG: APC family permease [Candidatus Eremiobacteraeota bacterium]|nr:APC family permease [Candidatus Eremiobacteraeota bacterium]MCL5055026.1 APC family permease [Bacillota bacterium]
MPEEKETSHQSGLRRDVTIWGSYMWGYADVGADVYVALGLVMFYAKGGTLYAFAFAGLVYILIGLAYTELASAYPVAGGGPYYALRGLGDFWALISGSALALDYTIDVALFALASAGYFDYFLPGRIVKASLYLGSYVPHFYWFQCLESIILIAFLIWINIIGIKESSLLNEVLGGFDICMESLIIIMGFVFAWKPNLFLHQIQFQLPNLYDFMRGSSLAIISYVGLESISQAAQETKRPSTVVPRTSLTLIFTVFLFALSFSSLGLGMLPWQMIAHHENNPIAVLASHLPLIGRMAGALAAVMGGLILLISSNSGVMSVSRLSYSLSQFNLIPKWFNEVHPKYKTPVRTILIFSGIAVIQTILAYLSHNALHTLGNMYAFGATLGYLLVFVSLIKLRLTDPYTPRPYKMPFNIKFKNIKGETLEFPLLSILGLIGVSAVLAAVIWTHKIARIASPIWILLWFAYYVWYRRKQKISVFQTTERDWESDQKSVLESAEEYDLLEQYKWALAERDKKARKN